LKDYKYTVQLYDPDLKSVNSIFILQYSNYFLHYQIFSTTEVWCG